VDNVEDPVVSWGVFDLSPTNNYLYNVQKAAYEPNGVFPEEYNTRFFAGETAQRTLRIYNDRMSAGNFTLRWRADRVPAEPLLHFARCRTAAGH